jgi:hypothetical protein
MNLQEQQREMRQRQKQRKTVMRKAVRSRAPKLQRGIYVAPIRRDKPVIDFPELQRMLTAHLRSPKIKSGDFYKLLDIGTRYGLVLPEMFSRPAEEAAEPSNDTVLKEALQMERENRAQLSKEREKNKQ